MRDVALFVPCFVDQFRPAAAVAAVQLLERLGWRVHVAMSARCCGQPPTNAGYAREGAELLTRFVEAHQREVPVAAPLVVLSGSCALHLQTHTAGALRRPVYEFTAFLHDVAGIEAITALAPRCDARVAVHIGCHALRGLALATPSERALPPMNKVTALLAAVADLEVVPLTRADECCGFGGTFAIGESALSVKMGRDRLRDVRAAHADAVVTTDLSCALHLESVAAATGAPLPMWHLAEVLAGAVQP